MMNLPSRKYVLIIPFVLVLLASCGGEEKSSRSGSNSSSDQPFPGSLRIEYSYDGEFGKYNIADGASAYDSGRLVATARATRIIKKEPGPNQIEVEETYYSVDGLVTYKGKLLIRFGFGGGHVDEEIPVSGRKRFSVFGGWPSGQ